MSTAAIAGDVRGGYWSVAFEMWRSAPMVGMGLWSGLHYQTLGHAHNIWLNTLAEQGRDDNERGVHLEHFGGAERPDHHIEHIQHSAE